MKRIRHTLLLLMLALQACKPTVIDTTDSNATLPPLLLLNRNVLERVKHDVQRNSTNVVPALDNLLRQANEILNENLSDAGHRATELSHITHAIPTLALAYYYTNDEKYASHATSLLRAWFIHPDTRISPQYDHEGGMSPTNGDYHPATSGLSLMLDYVILLSESNAWTDNDQQGFTQWIAEACQWLQTSQTGTNDSTLWDVRGTLHDLQVVAFSMFTGNTKQARSYLEQTAFRRIDKQLAPDGEQQSETSRTLPWASSTTNLHALTCLAILGERVGVNLWQHVTPTGATLRKAIEWFFPYLDNTKQPTAGTEQERDSRQLATVLAMVSRFSTQEYTRQLHNLEQFATDSFSFATSMLPLTYPIIEGTILSDADFFEALDLDREGMETVRQAVEQNDYDTAIHQLAHYMRTRDNSKWYFNCNDVTKPGTRNPDFDTTKADTVAANCFAPVNIAHCFGDSIDWSFNPTPIQYDEWTWKLNNHAFWTSLGEAYWATGNEKYAQAWVRQLRSWIIQSPLPDFCPGVDYSHWRTLETGGRASLRWPELFLRFIYSPSFDDETLVWMVKSFYEHAVHLRKSQRRNNWLAREMNGLFHIGLLFPEFKQSAAWCQYAIDRLYTEQKKQFYPDGAQVELAPGYHGNTINSILGIYDIAVIKHYPLPADYIQGMAAPYEYFQKICMPDGCTPALNDAGWGDARSKLEEALKLFPDRNDYRYTISQGKEGTPPAYTSAWLPYAGWYIMRSGWTANDLYAHFEVGPFAPAHNHEDKLSFILHANDKRLITEGGTFAYDTSRWRYHILSAGAHNVTRVDGMDQNRRALDNDSIRYNWSPLPNRWISTPDYDFGEGFYTEGFGPNHDTTVKQCRSLVRIANRYWLLFDIFTPSDSREHEYASWFHFNQTGHTMLPAHHAVSSSTANEAGVTIYPLRADAQSPQVFEGKDEPDMMGWVSPGGTYYLKPVATPMFTRRQAGTCVEPYLFYPTKEGKPQPIQKIETIQTDCVRITYSDGTTDTITWHVADGKMQNLAIDLNGRQLTILQ